MVTEVVVKLSNSNSRDQNGDNYGEKYLAEDWIIVCLTSRLRKTIVIIITRKLVTGESYYIYLFTSSRGIVK